VSGGDFRHSVAEAALKFGAWARRLSLYTIAIAFALAGHLVLASVLNALRSLGVDFDAIDGDRVAVPAIQVLLFAAQTGLIVVALVKSGIETRRTFGAVAALIFAAAMLMLTFVSAQCDLFGACL
jgi:hypothetical protein